MSNQRGMSSLLMVLILVGVVGALSMVLPDMFRQIDASSRVLILKSSAALAKENMTAALDNDSVLAATILHAANTAALNAGGANCLTTAGAICAFNLGAPVTLTVVEADGATLLTNPAVPTSGINTSGQPCATYGLADPGGCIFKLVARIECANPGACTPTVLTPGSTVPEKPKLKISAAFAYTPADSSLAGALKTGLTSNYNVDFERAGKNRKTLAKFCTSLNGNFNQQTLECDSPLGPASFDCRAMTGKTHVWFAGFDPTGSPKCMEDATVNAGCPTGTAMGGYNEQGTLICGGF